MAAQKGRLFTISVGDGTSPGNFTVVAGVQTVGLTINNDPVDITTQDEAPWRELLGDTGMRSMSISGSGIFKDDMSGINVLEDLANSGEIYDFQLDFANLDQYQGRMLVASFEYSGGHVEAQTFSITLESAGQWIFTRG